MRFVYNYYLSKKESVWKEESKSLSWIDLCKDLTNLKKEPEFLWLKDAYTQSLQSSIRNLDTAYHNYFRKGQKGNKVGFPKLKSKRSRQSFQLPQAVSVKGNLIKLGKFGWTHFYKSRELKGKIKTVTVSKTPTGRYFVSVLCDTGKALRKKKKIQESTAVGIDLGIKTFAYTSDGQVFKNQKYLRKSLKKLRVEQRSLSRKVLKSKSWEAQKLKVAKVYEKVTNQRRDYLHKVSTALIKKYDTIVIEDLNVAGMMQNKNLARQILDCSWWTFRSFLTYKADWYGKNLIVIGRFEPSSKMCSGCGEINKELKLSERNWECKSCGINHKRDFNAAQNIRQIGLNNVAGGAANCELTCGISQSVSQKTLNF